MDLNTLKNSAPWDWPVEAGEILIDVIRDKQAGEADRRMAVELAGDPVVTCDDVAGVLLQVVGSADESEALRGEAAISLGSILEEADILSADVFDDEEEYITEKMFAKIQKDLRRLFHDAGTHEEVRRRVLEASVRVSQGWHGGVVRGAYLADDEHWQRTAVFCMQYIRGFNEQILEALKSDDDLIHYHAINAAGNWAVAGAWPHIKGLIKAGDTDKDTLLAAIEAVVNLDSGQAPLVLGDLLDSDDEDIVDAVHEALSIAGGLAELEDFDDD